MLTKHAASSAWVNQEIGFATAHRKIVWPLAIDTDIQPYGMLGGTQAYSRLDWSHPDEAVSRLVTALKSTATAANPYQQFGFDHVIEGKIERTRFVAERLRELGKDKKSQLVILN